MASSSQNREATANKGGASSIATPANSSGSSLFGGPSVGAAHGAQGDASKAKSSTDYRRQSQESGGLFGNINNLKRGSGDQTAQARKNSLSEQKPAPGLIGQMWNNFTKGSGDNSNNK